jgi:hypothetical protein
MTYTSGVKCFNLKDVPDTEIGSEHHSLEEAHRPSKDHMCDKKSELLIDYDDPFKADNGGLSRCQSYSNMSSAQQDRIQTGYNGITQKSPFEGDRFINFRAINDNGISENFQTKIELFHQYPTNPENTAQ